MKTTLKIIRNITLTIVAAFIGIVVVLFIYYYPVIDRLYIRPCHYYPQAFIDCQ